MVVGNTTPTTTTTSANSASPTANLSTQIAQIKAETRTFFENVMRELDQIQADIAKSGL
jgi:hypothetical protein